MAKKVYAANVLAFLLLAGTLAAGAQSQSTIKVYLQDSLDTGAAQVGDTFTGTLADRVVVDGRVIGEEGDVVTGRVEEVVSSGRLKTPAEIKLSLVSVWHRRRMAPLESGDLTIKSGSHKKRNLAMIAGGAVAGAIIGAITGGKKGAAIGGAVGAGAGTAGAYITGKKEIVLPPETLLVFEEGSILMGTAELVGLQPPDHSGTETASRDREEDYEDEPALRRRRSRDDYEDEGEYRRRRDHDEEEDYEDYDGYRGPVPKEIEIEFEDHYTIVKVQWDDGDEKFRVRSRNYDQVLIVVSERTGLPHGWLKRNLRGDGKKFKFKHDRGVRDHGKGKGRGKGRKKNKH